MRRYKEFDVCTVHGPDGELLGEIYYGRWREAWAEEQGIVVMVEYDDDEQLELTS